jgi:hypothetical protein
MVFAKEVKSIVLCVLFFCTVPHRPRGLYSVLHCLFTLMQESVKQKKPPRKCLAALSVTC